MPAAQAAVRWNCWKGGFAMSELRLLFEKRGTARYISHLDLMQVFRRAFACADVPIGFTQGFHPHPNLNILLPLPTGFESVCELLDFALDAPRLPDQFLYRINRALPAGICVTSVGEARTPAKFIRYAAYEMNADIPIEAEQIAELFSREELVVTKRTKRGESETNILPLLRDLNVQTRDGGVTIRAKVAAGNENLNPEYILAAIEKYWGAGPAYASYLRREVYDAELRVFR